jgi:hypothetical protein
MLELIFMKSLLQLATSIGSSFIFWYFTIPLDEAKIFVLHMKFFQNYDRLAKQEMRPWLRS